MRSMGEVRVRAMEMAIALGHSPHPSSPPRGRGERRQRADLGYAAQPHLILPYLKLGESLAKIGMVTLSLIDQTISW